MRVFPLPVDLMMVAALAVAAIVASPARGDDRAPLPPLASAQQLPATTAPPKTPPVPAPAPTAADTALPPLPAQPQTHTITLHLVPQPPAAPAPVPQPPTPPASPAQTITLQIVPSAPAAAAPVVAAPAMAAPAMAQPTAAAQVVYPGMIRRAIGGMGELMARQKMARIYVPVPTAQPVQLVQFQPQPPIQAAMVPTPTPVIQYVEAQPALASPQQLIPAKKSCFLRR